MKNRTPSEKNWHKIVGMLKEDSNSKTKEENEGKTVKSRKKK